MINLTQEYLKTILHYDQLTGVFTWVNSTQWTKAKAIAGSIRKPPRLGYVRININKKSYFAHRLAWLYVYGAMPNGVVDHINGNPSDNRIVNLRDVTPLVNSRNLVNQRVNNKTGIQGVSFDKDRGLFLAQTRIEGKKINIGRFDTKEKAKTAYQQFVENRNG